MAFWIHSIQEWGNEREQMVQQLKNQQETLVEATKQRATQNERIRIAREVHDTLAQGFVAIIALSQSPGTRPQIEEIARENLAESRALMKSWRSPSLEKNDLPSAIHRLGKKHAARVSVKGDFSETSAEQQTAIFRAAQEALNNVSRHAEASDCSIALRADAGGYQLTIWDNGKGMSGELGNGLKGMVERAEALGGMVQIQSDYGTTLTFRIPKEQA
jgi:Signal transduction histidine kinase